MIRSALLLLLLHTTCALRVMSFNMWHFGEHVTDGVQKVADQIKYVDPDIVAIQEAGTSDSLDRLLSLLGDDWSGALNERRQKDGRGIISEYGGYSRGYNVLVQLRDSGQEIYVWSVYLHWKDYGPDEAMRGEATTMEKILKGEYETRTHYSRVHNIRELLADAEFLRQINTSDVTPVIVAGDFNTPSDLDWTEATKHIHFGWVVEWPVTKLLREEAGMTDSFREVHPDPVAVPGHTWGVYDEEVKDRIDFIFYRGPLRATRSFPFSGPTPVLYPKMHTGDREIKAGYFLGCINDWPSDHFAVVTEFEPRVAEVIETTTTTTTTITTMTSSTSTASPEVEVSTVNASWSYRVLSVTAAVIALLMLSNLR